MVTLNLKELYELLTRTEPREKYCFIYFGEGNEGNSKDKPNRRCVVGEDFLALNIGKDQYFKNNYHFIYDCYSKASWPKVYDIYRNIFERYTKQKCDKKIVVLTGPWVTRPNIMFYEDERAKFYGVLNNLVLKAIQAKDNIFLSHLISGTFKELQITLKEGLKSNDIRSLKEYWLFNHATDIEEELIFKIGCELKGSIIFDINRLKRSIWFGIKISEENLYTWGYEYFIPSMFADIKISTKLKNDFRNYVINQERESNNLRKGIRKQLRRKGRIITKVEDFIFKYYLYGNIIPAEIEKFSSEEFEKEFDKYIINPHKHLPEIRSLSAGIEDYMKNLVKAGEQKETINQKEIIKIVLNNLLWEEAFFDKDDYYE